MILNSYIIIYLICSVMSLYIGLVALFNGFYILMRWDKHNDTEEQYYLEKRVYLIITVLFIGFSLRIFMFPLWFFTLNSMIISIPGAMCLVGVHNVSPTVAYTSSALKLILPSLYLYWLVLNFLDRKVETQPFMKKKLWLLTPLGVLILTETVLDISFFFSVPPRQVSCCTSLFDVPRDDLLQIAVESTWRWVVIFYIMAAFFFSESVYFLTAQKKGLISGKNWWGAKKWLIFLQTILILSTMIVFILAFQTKIAPLFLKLPFHQCIFCLCQEVWDALLSFFMIFSGLLFLLIYFWIAADTDYGTANQKFHKPMVNILTWSTCLFAGGTIILSIHLIYILLN